MFSGKLESRWEFNTSFARQTSVSESRRAEEDSEVERRSSSEDSRFTSRVDSSDAVLSQVSRSPRLDLSGKREKETSGTPTFCF